MFDVVINQFDDLKSEHMRFKVLEQMGVLIKPKEIVIGTTLVHKLKNNKKTLELIEVKMYSIPLPQICKHRFKVIFEQQNVYQTVISFINELQNNNKIISSFVQSDT